MSKAILEVKEFDKITCNEAYQDNPNYSYLNPQSFNNLIAFLHEFSSTAGDDAHDCLSLKDVSGLGLVISTKNYVGLIQMKNGDQVHILPKICLANGEDATNKDSKSVFIKMLRCMDDFNFKVYSEANLNIDKMNLYEIFVNMYLQEVSNLVKYGLKSGYITEEDNLPTLRGKLKIKEHLAKNAVHKEKFYCAFDEYHINRPENKLIKATLLKLNDITERFENKKIIRQLLTHFEQVDTSVNYDSDFTKISLDRSMRNYELAIKWAMIFLKHKSFTTFSGGTVARSLLFPMDKLFEGYVAKKLKRCFADTDWSVSTQDKGHYLFDEPSAKFALKPDIVLSKPDGTQIILDTKWKRLVDNARINYGISQSDMYQMYAYAKKYATGSDTSPVWLLYPLNKEMRNHEPISFTSDDNVNVKIFFVDVANIEESLNDLKKQINELN